MTLQFLSLFTNAQIRRSLYLADPNLNIHYQSITLKWSLEILKWPIKTLKWPIKTLKWSLFIVWKWLLTTLKWSLAILKWSIRKYVSCKRPSHNETASYKVSYILFFPYFSFHIQTRKRDLSLSLISFSVISTH